MQTTLWLQALSFPVLLYHCWATVGPSKLMQAFIRLWDSWQPWPPGYSNSVILDKAKNSPCLGHFCRGWSRYGAKHDKEVPHLDGWNWVLNTYIVVISYFLSMLLKGDGDEMLQQENRKWRTDWSPWHERVSQCALVHSRLSNPVMLLLPGRVLLLWRVAAKQRRPNCKQQNVNSYQPLGTRGRLSASTLTTADFSWSETNSAQMIDLIS